MICPFTFRKIGQKSENSHFLNKKGRKVPIIVINPYDSPSLKEEKKGKK